jgi:UDP-N-acetylglucosamine 2-epimerase (non-hydrolysing)
MKILAICGARPNFMKIAAVVGACEEFPSLEPVIVHTGQHYDERLSKVMFEDLGLPRPQVNLEVGSASHAVQTAEIMRRFEPVVEEERPDLVMVVGDVNSTIACSLVAAKREIAVAHVEAGLRSRDRSMPEEINRVATDALSDLLFASEEAGARNLRAEGVPEANVFFVGNVMIDTLLAHRRRSLASGVLDELGLEEGDYAVLTLHRPSNVDDPDTLRGLLDAVERIARRLPVAFPIHPRTRARIDEFGFGDRLDRMDGLVLVPPQGYLDFLRLTGSARLILTDSGGIQEEAAILEVPCLTLRENTERPATLATGWNRLLGSDPERIVAAAEEILAGGGRGSGAPALWDGGSGRRIAEILDRLGPDGVERLRRRRGG